jgi:hypothetical protein
MLFFTLLFTFCCDLSIREENSKSATRVKAPQRRGAYEIKHIWQDLILF